jgi:hypothetical protein
MLLPARVATLLPLRPRLPWLRRLLLWMPVPLRLAKPCWEVTPEVRVLLRPLWKLLRP